MRGHLYGDRSLSLESALVETIRQGQVGCVCACVCVCVCVCVCEGGVSALLCAWYWLTCSPQSMILELLVNKET